jgi:hypothetical protein
VLVPGPETTGPATRHIHLPDHDVLAADVAHEGDGTVDQHPPEVGVVALVEQVDAWLDSHLGAGLGQLSELSVGQTVEEVYCAEVVGSHQTVAR